VNQGKKEIQTTAGVKELSLPHRQWLDSRARWL